MFTQARRFSLLALGTASSIHLHKSYSSPECLNLKDFKDNLPPNSYSATYDANNPSEDRLVRYKPVLDWHCSAIFDGHGGWQVSEFVSQTILDHLEFNLIKENRQQTNEELTNLMVQTFTQVEDDYLNQVRSAYKLGFGDVAKVGSCTLVAMKKNDHLIVANCGDSRAILATKNSQLQSSLKYIATRLTNDHNARELIEQEKLYREHPNEPDVVKCHNSHACYVKGRLQLTRAIGDAYLKYKEFNASPSNPKSR
jgi:pyruvate dehydrogenase phosphatase